MIWRMRDQGTVCTLYTEYKYIQTYKEFVYLPMNCCSRGTGLKLLSKQKRPVLGLTRRKVATSWDRIMKPNKQTNVDEKMKIKEQGRIMFYSLKSFPSQILNPLPKDLVSFIFSIFSVADPESGSGSDSGEIKWIWILILFFFCKTYNTRTIFVFHP